MGHSSSEFNLSHSQDALKDFVSEFVYSFPMDQEESKSIINSKKSNDCLNDIYNDKDNNSDNKNNTINISSMSFHRPNLVLLSDTSSKIYNDNNNNNKNNKKNHINSININHNDINNNNNNNSSSNNNHSNTDSNNINEISGMNSIDYTPNCNKNHQKQKIDEEIRINNNNNRANCMHLDKNMDNKSTNNNKCNTIMSKWIGNKNYTIPSEKSRNLYLRSNIGGRLKGKKPPRKWTAEEDEKLKKAVSEYGQKNWKNIAERVKGRNHTQCLQRWTKVLAPGLIKGHWRPEEDERLIELVAEGRRNWGQLAMQVPGRTSKQCRERWYNHLDPSIVRGEYTQEEDCLILEAQSKLGNRWSTIASLLPGRTEDAIKIRFKTLERNRCKNMKLDNGSNKEFTRRFKRCNKKKNGIINKNAIDIAKNAATIHSQATKHERIRRQYESLVANSIHKTEGTTHSHCKRKNQPNNFTHQTSKYKANDYLLVNDPNKIIWNNKMISCCEKNIPYGYVGSDPSLSNTNYSYITDNFKNLNTGTFWHDCDTLIKEDELNLSFSQDILPDPEIINIENKNDFNPLSCDVLSRKDMKHCLAEVNSSIQNIFSPLCTNHENKNIDHYYYGYNAQEKDITENNTFEIPVDPLDIRSMDYNIYPTMSPSFMESFSNNRSNKNRNNVNKDFIQNNGYPIHPVSVIENMNISDKNLHNTFDLPTIYPKTETYGSKYNEDTKNNIKNRSNKNYKLINHVEQEEPEKSPKGLLNIEKNKFCIYNKSNNEHEDSKCISAVHALAKFAKEKKNKKKRSCPNVISISSHNKNYSKTSNIKVDDFIQKKYQVYPWK